METRSMMKVMIRRLTTATSEPCLAAVGLALLAAVLAACNGGRSGY
jgi:hypothetical protein